MLQSRSTRQYDERGQMILSKETREGAGFKASDKLAIISSGKNDKTCCLSIIKADELMGMVKDMLVPMLGDLLQNKNGEHVK